MAPPKRKTLASKGKTQVPIQSTPKTSKWRKLKAFKVDSSYAQIGSDNETSLSNDSHPHITKLQSTTIDDP